MARDDWFSQASDKTWAQQVDEALDKLTDNTGAAVVPVPEPAVAAPEEAPEVVTS